MENQIKQPRPRGSRIKEAGESVLGADWGICPGGRLEDGIIGCTL